VTPPPTPPPTPLGTFAPWEMETPEATFGSPRFLLNPADGSAEMLTPPPVAIPHSSETAAPQLTRDESLTIGGDEDEPSSRAR
jgi:hypothetical protein